MLPLRLFTNYLIWRFFSFMKYEDLVWYRQRLKEGKFAVLLHDCILSLKGKTGLGFIRYSQANIVACIDHQTAGKNFTALCKIPRDISIVSNVRQAYELGADTIIVGIAPTGGAIPKIFLQELLDATALGMSIVNGLHEHLDENVEFLSKLQSGQKILEIRQEPENLCVGRGLAANLPGKRVLTVGTDMYAGKMTTCLELHKLASKRQLRSTFIGTGQTGIMISGHGVALDAIRLDFASGVIEQAVLESGKEADTIFIEGQGSLFHPGSSATLPLIRGSQPTHLILVHRALDEQLLDHSEISVPPLSQVAKLYEQLASSCGVFGYPKTVGIALNTVSLDEESADQVIAKVQKETSLPCVDPLRHGTDKLLDAILQS